MNKKLMELIETYGKAMFEYGECRSDAGFESNIATHAKKEIKEYLEYQNRVMGIYENG